MKQYVFTILITWLITYSITYALSQETTQEKLERENKAILETYAKEQRDCYDNATGSSIEISQKYDLCKLRPKPQLKTISWDWNSWSSGEVIEVNWTHSTGSTVPPQWQEAVEIAKKKFAHAKLYQDVCKKQINSPLCKDRELFDRLYQLTEERLPWKNFYPILIGMTNAESSLGLDYAKDNVWWTCNGRNNWGGAKYIIKDDNSRDYSRSLNWFLYWEEYSWRFVDQYWCNLFPFKSIEEYWISKVNWIRYWYAWCVDHERPIWCISGKYVWNAKVHEQSWIDNVSVFLN